MPSITRDGLFLAAGEPYEVMIVDRMLQGLDKLAIVKTLRAALETHKSRLKAKVDRGHDRELIHTARGAGYALRAPD
jgi:DNA-binding response OmpR family regulator